MRHLSLELQHGRRGVAKLKRESLSLPRSNPFYRSPSLPAATQPCARADLPAARVAAGPRAGWSVPGPARLPFAPAALSMLCSDLWYCPVLRWSGRVCGAADLLHQRRPFVPRVLKLSLPPLRSWPQLRLPSTVYYYGLLLPPGRILACPPVALLAGAPQHARVLLVAHASIAGPLLGGPPRHLQPL